MDPDNEKAIERHLSGEAGYFFLCFTSFFPLFILGTDLTLLITFNICIHTSVYVDPCVYIYEACIYAYIDCTHINKSRFPYLFVATRTLAVLQQRNYFPFIV